MFGIEFNQSAALTWGTTSDEVLAGEFYETAPKLLRDEFDCIVVNNVIEHLVNPRQVLALLRELLKPSGRLVPSLPNVRFWGVVKDLVWNGAWNCTDRGVLNRTHMRFFTRSSIIDLLRKTRFTDVSIDGINPQLSGWKVDAVNALTARRFDDMRYLQFAARAMRGSTD